MPRDVPDTCKWCKSELIECKKAYPSGQFRLKYRCGTLYYADDEVWYRTTSPICYEEERMSQGNLSCLLQNIKYEVTECKDSINKILILLKKENEELRIAKAIDKANRSSYPWHLTDK